MIAFGARGWRSGIAGVAALSATLSIAEPALAHAILLASTPAANATVSPGPIDVELRFNSRIDHARSMLKLVRTDRSETAMTIALEDGPDLLHSRVDLLAPGRYLLRWQVLALDGHITRGEIAFQAREP